MCGICGIVDFGPSFIETAQNIQPMLDRMTHRGPQGSGVNRSGRALFGTQRLAIRSLNDGVQPLLDAESGVIVVCNGEIDNHGELRAWLESRGRPVTQTVDVAVLPALYLELGAAFVEKLEGVYAIALWDPKRETLILTRDRAGERPLFYRKDGAAINFATEVSALTASAPGMAQPDPAAISMYLQCGCFPAPFSPFDDIRKVKAGEMITFTPAGETHRQYWRWPIAEATRAKPDVAHFDRLFRKAVYSQSNVDVPFGLFLSGGVDSSLIAAVAKDVHGGRALPCYTLRFTEESYDEGAYADRVAGMLGFETTKVMITPEMFMTELPRLVRVSGEPLADPAWVPTAMLAARAAQDVRIVLSGEGGDELFGGYPTYLGAHLAYWYRRLPSPLRAGMAALSEKLPQSDKKMPLSFLLKRFVAGDGMDPFPRHRLWTATVPPHVLNRLGVDARPVAPELAYDARGVFEEKTVGGLQRYDLEVTLAEGLLTKADRGGMSASLEIRAPFLDRDVMDFAAGLPEDQKVRGLTTKYFLKKYAGNYLPHGIVHRRKRGLSVPMAAWLRGPMRDWAQNKLGCGRLGAAGVDPAEALALLEEHARQQADHARTLWALLVLDEWLAWVLEQEKSAHACN